MAKMTFQQMVTVFNKAFFGLATLREKKISFDDNITAFSSIDGVE